jgi:glycosyltransferase involved in cell wall biosynthesis
MKVLWITSYLFPEVCSLLKIEMPFEGGWVQSSAKIFLEFNPSAKLAVACLYNGKKFRRIVDFEITYYLIPKCGIFRSKNKNLEKFYKDVQFDFQPDIIHIHGSEYYHSLAWVRACDSERVVVSIQGLVSIYAKYYLGGILEKDVCQNISFRDFIRKDSMFNQRKNMQERGCFEIELLEKVKFVIGRTSWDLSNTWAINQKIRYYFCNETLRSPFYEKHWNLKNCIKYSIFLSQAHYPIKGLQQLIKALPVILSQFPETAVYVSGSNIFNKPWYRRNGFSNYLEKLMIENQIPREKIIFLGPLSDHQMVQQFISAHVFLSPSAIENSPNSLGESQLIGTPCVASYVGGTMDMIEDGETGLLYRFEEIALLAKHICAIFNDDKLANYISSNSQKKAVIRHDKIKNASQLNLIYKEIINENKLDI